MPTFGFVIDIEEFLSLLFSLPVRGLIADNEDVCRMAHPILNYRACLPCKLLGIGAK